jgi:hypothetical protein
MLPGAMAQDVEAWYVNECYQADQFSNSFHLKAIAFTAEQDIVLDQVLLPELTGLWIGPNAYTIGVKGTAWSDLGGTSGVHRDLGGPNGTTGFFAGNQVCSVQITITNFSTPNKGTFKVQCSGNAATPFSPASATLTRVDCQQATKHLQAIVSHYSPEELASMSIGASIGR